MNKDEAERCSKLARDYYNKGDYESALKFYRKSYRLHEDSLTLDLIHKCEVAKNQQQSSGQSGTARPQSEPRPSNTENAGSSGSSTPHQSNPQKVAEIKKLINTKDFYEILGVAKTATEDEIKKSYKKLALKFHPDKNKEPGADEAFKKLAQAYDCLVNTDKRKKYDEFGNEEPEQHYRHYRQYYNEDISAEDIFGMFFGNAFFDDGQARRRYVYRQRQPQGGQARRNSQQGGNNTGFKYLPLLQFLPLLIIIISSFALNLGHDEPPYSQVLTPRFPIERRTHNLKLSYYVDSNFNTNYGQKKTKLVQFEEGVEREYISKLAHRCNIATQKKGALERQAYYRSGDSKQALMQQASQIDLSDCDKYLNIKAQFRHLFYY